MGAGEDSWYNGCGGSSRSVSQEVAVNNRALVLLLCVALVATPALYSADASQDSSQQSLQSSSEDSLQNSSQQSSQDSFEQTTGGSFQATTQGSADSSDESTAELGQGSAVVLMVAGAAVAVGVTAVGITLIVRVNSAERENVVAFQDQIYAGSGPDFDLLVLEYGVAEAELARANDELVAAGYGIESDQDAAVYLAELFLRLNLAALAEAA